MSGKSPKKPGGWGELTSGETKMLLASVLCTTGGKIDTKKLGELTDMKRKSAASHFPSAKRKLEKLFEDKLDNTDGDAEQESPKGQSPAKRRRKTTKADAEAQDSDADAKADNQVAIKNDPVSEAESETIIKIENQSDKAVEDNLDMEDDTFDISTDTIE